MGMEKTMEQIENILARATLDQLKIILRFLRNIIKYAPEWETVPAGKLGVTMLAWVVPCGDCRVSGLENSLVILIWEIGT